MNPCPHCGRPNPPSALTCAACQKSLRAASPNGRPGISLRVVRADGGAEAVVIMKGEQLACGKTGDLAFADDPFVADIQMRLFFDKNQLAIEDVGGGNGTFLRVREERELSPGGELRVGRQRLVLEPIPPIRPGPGGAIAWGSAESEHSRFRLVQLFEGGALGNAYLLRDGVQTIGREAGDITFAQDGFVSGRHATVEQRGEKVFVQDVGSSNGTFVRLTSPTIVKSGDQFLVGRQLVRVEIRA